MYPCTLYHCNSYLFPVLTFATLLYFSKSVQSKVDGILVSIHNGAFPLHKPRLCCLLPYTPPTPDHESQQFIWIIRTALL